MKAEGEQPAAEEDGRHDARHHDHVQVLGEVVGGEAPAAVLGVVAAHELGVRLREVEGRAVCLGEARDEEDQKARQLRHHVPHARLGMDDAGQRQRLRGDDDAHQRESL